MREPSETFAPARWPELMSPETLAEYLDLSVRWVQRETAAGNLPAPVKLGSSTRYKKSEVDQWCETLKGVRR